MTRVEELIANLEESLERARAMVQTKYDGPDPSVECAYPPCSNRLRRADFEGPQWCSRHHRTLTLEAE